MGSNIFWVAACAILGYVIYRLFKWKKEGLLRDLAASRNRLVLELKKWDYAYEGRLRKQWLISLCIITTLSIIFAYLAYLGNTIQASDKPHVVIVETFTMGFYIGQSLIAFGISYYCAYKRSGTSWLLWTLISGIIIQFITLFQLIGKHRMDEDIIELVIGLFIFGIDTYFLVNCFRLRKVNLAKKRCCPLKIVND